MKAFSVPRFPAGRHGFTLLETMVALGILGVVLLVLAQLAYLLLCERQRDAARQEAVEEAANVLEAARACSWEDLTPAWAARQRLPGPLAGRLRDGRLEVRVEPEASRPQTRRVTVEVRWSLEDGKPARPVQLVTLRSARSAPATGGKP
jgi:prepilin-type N-terminal cleavage/methylation domain-containing protein